MHFGYKVMHMFVCIYVCVCVCVCVCVNVLYIKKSRHMKTLNKYNYSAQLQVSAYNSREFQAKILRFINKINRYRRATL
jgi:hypothetical protein